MQREDLLSRLSLLIPNSGVSRISATRAVNIDPKGNSVEPSINVTTENEHIEEAEIKIRTVKEGARSMRAMIPIFRKIPRILVILLIDAVLFWLNCIQTKFSNYSPARIIKDQVIDYKVHCKHQLGEFVQVVKKTTNLIEVSHKINALAAYPTGNKQGTWRYFNIATGKPISHKKATNLPIPLNLPDWINALAANESEDFIILDIHGNPFVGSDNIFDDSSVDTDSAEVETVDHDDVSSFDSEDDKGDSENENSIVSDGRPSKEGVNERDIQESKEKQGHFGTCIMRGNLPPPRASHRSGLRQPRHVNCTHKMVNHTNNNSKTRSTPNSHINKKNKRQSTPKRKYEYIDDTDVVIKNSKKRTSSSKKKTMKHKSRDQENPYYNHNSSQDMKIKPFLML